MNRFGDIDWSFKSFPPVDGFHSEELVSIDKALQPLESQIKELCHYVEIAKKHCHYPNEHGLSKDESASIYIYAMECGESSLYRVLNQVLRSENRQTLQIWFPYLKLFNTALDLLPTVKESVWRGISLDMSENFPVNQMFTWWTVSSCSLSIDIIERFLNNKQNSTLFLIDVINGKKISGYTQFENEDEVILRAGTQFRVIENTSVRIHSSHTVHLIEVYDKNDNNEQLLVTAIQSFDVTRKLSIKQIPNQLKSNLKWKPRAKMIAGGNQLAGDKTDQLFWPAGICVDNEQQSIYIVDRENRRILKWKFDENNGQIVAGGNGRGNRTDQLAYPIDVILNQNNKSLIISDFGNRSVVRWSLENQQNIEILISDIGCWGLMMNENGDLFVSDHEKHQVKKWTKDKNEQTVVAGGNGKGQRRNQLDSPTFIFVDRNDTVYVSDQSNHRVMKWVKGAKEGIVVAGGQGRGNTFKQLSYPDGLIVDEIGDVYVADSGNHRIMCWPSGSKEGRLVLAGNGPGIRLNQFHYMGGLAFDCHNNLYATDQYNNRILRFQVIQS